MEVFKSLMGDFILLEISYFLMEVCIHNVNTVNLLVFELLFSSNNIKWMGALKSNTGRLQETLRLQI